MVSNMDSNSFVRAFTAEHMSRVTGLSERQLRNWDEIGLFRPQFAYERAGSAYHFFEKASRIAFIRPSVEFVAGALLLHAVSTSCLRLPVALSNFI
jgi:hypothetical protein